jgi:recombination protein RecT
MANLQTTQKRTIKGLMQNPEVQKRFSEMLGERSNQFITSVLQVANSNKLLQNATPESIYGAALTAASLDLPINQNLGFAYIV